MEWTTLAKLAPVGMVALVLTAGAHAGRQVSQPAFLTQPAWSPDGKHVAWVAGPPNGYGTVWVADASGRRARPLHQFGHSLLDGVDGVGQITWATSRSLLVDAQLNGNVQLFRLTLSGRIRALEQLSDLNFSTDRSRRLVATTGYTSACGHQDCPAPVDIFNTASGKVSAVGSSEEEDLYPALAPNAKHVVFDRVACTETVCHHPQGLWLTAASGNGAEHELEQRGEYPVWSPNGRLIAYVKPWKHQTFLLEALRLGRKARAFGSRSNGAPPVFSPDSRYVAYIGAYGRYNNKLG